MLRNCFTPTDAIEAFIDSTEFEFHPTNVGMILKENKIEPLVTQKMELNYMMASIGKWF